MKEKCTQIIRGTCIRFCSPVFSYPYYIIIILFSVFLKEPLRHKKECDGKVERSGSEKRKDESGWRLAMEKRGLRTEFRVYKRFSVFGT